MLYTSQALSARSLCEHSNFTAGPTVMEQQCFPLEHSPGTQAGVGSRCGWSCVLPSPHQENSVLSQWCSSQHRIWVQVINARAADGVCHTFFNSGETKRIKPFWKTLLLLWLLMLEVTLSFCGRGVWDRKRKSLCSKFCLLAFSLKVKGKAIGIIL